MAQKRICPSCRQEGTIILDSRHTSEGQIKRRVECKNCGYRWNTIEVSEEEFGHYIKAFTAEDKLLLKRVCDKIPTDLLSQDARRAVAILWKRLIK